MGRVSYRPERVLIGGKRKTDPDEDAAMEKAIEAVRENLAERNPDRIAYYAISSWIMERTLRCAAKGMAVGLGYDLDDTHLRGLATASLPDIAKSLTNAGVDGSVPFYELSSEDIASVVVACFLSMKEATKLNDAIPF